MERPELRSVETGSRWSDVVGPVMRPATLAARWKVTVEDVDAMVVDGRLLALTTADEAVVFPVFQFDAELKPIGPLSEVLHLLTADVVDCWTCAAWLVAPQLQLGERSVVEYLRDGGDVAAAVSVATSARGRWAA